MTTPRDRRGAGLGTRGRDHTRRPERPAGPLPTFLIIGAMKAGTTSLYHYIREHPQVYMPPFKAPEFFAGGSHWRRGVDWYRRQFADAGPDAVAIGEASNVYTKYPRYTGVPARVAEYIPQARLVYIVRNPIDRIRSHYQTRAAEGTEKAPFEQAVFDNPIYVDYSRYALQLEQYLPHFPREQLLVITSDELRTAREDTMRRVYGFIGVRPDFVPQNLGRDFYRTDERPARSMVPVWVRKRLKTYFPSAKRAKELENNVKRRIRALRGGHHEAAATPSLTVPADVRAQLASLLADDVRRLRDYLGPDFDGWGIA